MELRCSTAVGKQAGAAVSRSLHEKGMAFSPRAPIVSIPRGKLLGQFPAMSMKHSNECITCVPRLHLALLLARMVLACRLVIQPMATHRICLRAAATNGMMVFDTPQATGLSRVANLAFSIMRHKTALRSWIMSQGALLLCWAIMYVGKPTTVYDP